MRTLLGMLAVAMLALNPARAQLSKFSMNLGYGRMPVKGSYTERLEHATATQAVGEYARVDVNSHAFIVTLGAAFDAPVWKISDEQAVGVSLNIAGGLVGAPLEIYGFNLTALLDMPEYVTWRKGCRASKDADANWGIGVGAGYRFCRYHLPFSSPSVMLEGTHTYGSNSDIYLRLTADLQPNRTYEYFSSRGPVSAITIRQQLMVTMGIAY